MSCKASTVFQVLNLFLALLLNSFATDSLRRSKETREDSKMKMGWKRLKGIFSKRSQVEPESEEAKKPSITLVLEELKKRKAQQDLENAQKETVGEGGSEKEQDETTMTVDRKSGENTTHAANGEVVPTRQHEATEKSVDHQSGSKDDKNLSKKIENPFQTDRAKYSKFSAVMKKDAEVASTTSSPQSVNGSSGATTSKAKVSMLLSKKEQEDDDDDDNESRAPNGDVADCWPACCYKQR